MIACPTPTNMQVTGRRLRDPLFSHQHRIALLTALHSEPSWGLPTSLLILVSHSVTPWSRSSGHTSSERGLKYLSYDLKYSHTRFLIWPYEHHSYSYSPKPRRMLLHQDQLQRQLFYVHWTQLECRLLSAWACLKNDGILFVLLFSVRWFLLADWTTHHELPCGRQPAVPKAYLELVLAPRRVKVALAIWVYSIAYCKLLWVEASERHQRRVWSDRGAHQFFLVIRKWS